MYCYFPLKYSNSYVWVLSYEIYVHPAGRFIFTLWCCFCYLFISVCGLTISVLKGCEMRGENSEVILVDVSLFLIRENG